MEKEYHIKVGGLCPFRIPNLFVRMSLFLIIPMLLFQQPLAAKDSLKNPSVTFSVSEEKMENVFRIIEKQTGYKFFYLDQQLDRNAKITISVKNVSLEKALEQILESSSLTFTINGKQIVLRKVRKDLGNAGGQEQSVWEQIEVADVRELTESLVLSKEIITTGRVTDEAGEPLPGVNVLVKGSTIGTTTDVSGRYSISLPDEPVTLVFSFIGYQPQEIPTNGRTVIDVKLAIDVKTLEDVVVVGYGVTSKRSLTGAVTSVKSNELTALKVQSMDAMLQGRGSGIQVNEATGVPGGPVRVLIRGTNSITAKTEPLWVIDGIPVNVDPAGLGGAGRGVVPQNPLATINPNDIESIEVLKDAYATAIYGSRGSSGVILVTTKSGRGSTGSVSFDANFGVSELTKHPDEMGFANADQWLAIVNRARQNFGITIPIQDVLGTLTPVNAGPSGLAPNQMTDIFWADQILRRGAFQEYNMSMSKGFESGNIFASGNYRKDEGVLQNNTFERLSFRLNGEFEPLKNLTTGLRMNLSHTKNYRPLNGGQPGGNDNIAAGGFSAAAGNALPIIPYYNADGSYFNPTSGFNLAATTDPGLFEDEFVVYRALGGINLEYRVPFIEGLSLRTEASADVSSSNRLFWGSERLRPTNINYAENAMSQSVNMLYNFQVRYSKTLLENHKANLVAGTESQILYGRGSNIFGEGIPGLNQDFGSPTAPVTRAPSAGLGGEEYIRSYFGRADYTFKDRYILAASFRYDATSIFRASHRWAGFPAVSAGWIFTEEAFLKNFSILNFGKLRASYGKTGNKDIYSLATFTTTTTWPRYGSADGAQLVNNIGNQKLRWETTTGLDVAVETGWLNDRITFSAGYYRQDVSDLLFRVPVGLSVGLFEGSDMWANVGDMRNQGWEFTLNTVNVERGKFQWKTGFNLTTNKNKVLSIIDELDTRGQGLNMGLTRNISGMPLSTFFMAEYAGIDQNTGVPMIYEIDRVLFGETGQTVKTGNVIPATNANLQNHRILQEDKTGLPTFFGGITNTISYGNFELTALLSFQGGNYLYNSAEIGQTWVGQQGNNLYADLLTDSWTPENREARYPKLTWNSNYNINNEGTPNFNANGTPNNNVNYAAGGLDRASTRYVYRGDFMRLRTIQLAYTFDKAALSRARIKGLRIFVNANNLFTFTRFPGWDPEQLNFSGDEAARNLTQGVVNNTLPPLKTYSAGLSLTL